MSKNTFQWFFDNDVMLYVYLDNFDYLIYELLDKRKDKILCNTL